MTITYREHNNCNHIIEKLLSLITTIQFHSRSLLLNLHIILNPIFNPQHGEVARYQMKALVNVGNINQPQPTPTTNTQHCHYSQPRHTTPPPTIVLVNCLTKIT